MHNSIDLSERSSDNNKEKEEKKRENGIVTPECYHDPSYFLAPLLLRPPIFHYRRFDGTESLFSSRLADYLGSIA